MLSGDWLICLFLVLGILLLYFRVVSFPFVNFDDSVFVFGNEHVAAGLTWEGIRWAFTTAYYDFWHPLVWLSHMFDCECFGLQAGFHHLTNVFIHAVNTVLVFLLLRILISNPKSETLVWPCA